MYQLSYIEKGKQHNFGIIVNNLGKDFDRKDFVSKSVNYLLTRFQDLITHYPKMLNRDIVIVKYNTTQVIGILCAKDEDERT